MERLKPRIILASQSRARQDMLRQAGIEFEVKPAHLDEERFMAEAERGAMSSIEIAQALADEKALAVSRENAGALVIGGDQIHEFEGTISSKAASAEEAREKLRAMSGKTHILISASAVARDGEVLWRGHDIVKMHMRELAPEVLDDYCRAAGDMLTRCAGGYALDGPGVWLFEKVEGDYFTVLGLPLLDLLGYLKEAHGVGP